MDNRRLLYRHTFPPGTRPSVELVLPAGQKSIRGEAIDLSVGGVRVELADPTVPLRTGDRLVAALTRRLSNRVDLQLSAVSAIVYVETCNNLRYCGVRFLPSVDPLSNETREATLWRFLLNEQRATLQRRRHLRG